MESALPTHDLATIQSTVRAGKYVALGGALEGLNDLGLDEDDMVECILGICHADFHKTMESVKRPGLWQDVYRPLYEGIRIYVKVQLTRTGKEESTVIISFKRK